MKTTVFMIAAIIAAAIVPAVSAIHEGGPTESTESTANQGMDCQGSLGIPMPTEQIAQCRENNSIEMLTNVINHSQTLQKQNELPSEEVENPCDDLVVYNSNSCEEEKENDTLQPQPETEPEVPGTGLTQIELEARGNFTRAVCDANFATDKECMQIMIDLWRR